MSIAGIWQLVFSFAGPKELAAGRLVCKAFARDILETVQDIKINCSEEAKGTRKPLLKQADLQYIAKTFPNIAKLKIIYSYSREIEDQLFNFRKEPLGTPVPEGSDMLDFSVVCFPKLKELQLNIVPLVTIHFTSANTPLLEDLDIDSLYWDEDSNTEGQMPCQGFYLDLPHLRKLRLHGFWVHDGSDWGASLSRCPRLESVDMRETSGWCPPSEHFQCVPHSLHLPECKWVDFANWENVSELEVDAPKLTSLQVTTSTSLRTVRFLGKEAEPKIGIVLINTLLDEGSMQYLYDHPRVGKDNVCTNMDDDDQWYGMEEEEELYGEEVDDDGWYDDGHDDDYDSGAEEGA